QIGGSSVWSVYGPGSIDDVRIYDRALSAAEIQSLYNGGGGSCTSPDGTEGTMIYNADDSVMQYCNGAEWIGVGK
ncbi:MAG: hypothetical protein EOM26_12890, partial [Alphaproteobacteria bacterium]|nr:hypothetical protein [Alphaproteobacteria bacterium]